MSKILEVLQKSNSNVPIWIMRQAGRYLPEYMKIRKTVNSFLDLCYDVEKATEVTLQPIKRYDFDAAIVFSDILVLPDALGWDVRFEENIGPILHKFQSEDDFKYFKNPSKKLEIVYNIIKRLKKKLPEKTSLIGFAGSPWTVMSYMLEGRGKHDFKNSKKFIYENKKLAEKLIEFLTEETINYLTGQINAGADVIKLFDSWSGVLSGQEYEKFVIKPTKKIVSSLKKHQASTPIIGFPKNSGLLYKKYIENTGIDVIACDQFVPLDIMKSWSEKIVVQGNLDPVVLLTNKTIIEEKAKEILLNFAGKNFIFNLGHGILPDTPVENVEFLVNYVKEFRF